MFAPLSKNVCKYKAICFPPPPKSDAFSESIKEKSQVLKTRKLS